MKKTVSLLAALLCCLQTFLLLVLPVRAEEEFDDISLDRAEAVYLYNVENEKLLVSKNTDKKLAPASTVKIMTGLITAEKLGGRLDEKVTVTRELLAGFVSGSRSVGLYAGQTPTVRDLMYMAFCGSYNDAVAMLVNLAAGSEISFTALMNQRAAELGMKNTKYVNPTGVHSDAMYTTAEDVAVLALTAYRSDLLRSVTSAARYKTEGLAKQFTVDNYNYLMVSGRYFNSLCRGLNAGSTPAAGCSLVTVSESKGLSYLCVVMGAEEDDNGNVHSYLIANKLINAAYERYGYVRVLDTTRVICEMPVTMSLDISSVLIVPERELSAYLPVSLVLGEDVTYDYRLTSETLEAPVTEGTQVGFISAWRGEELLGTTALITKSGVEKSDLLYAMERIRAFSQSRFFMATVVIAAALTLIYLVLAAIWRASSAKAGKRRR